MIRNVINIVSNTVQDSAKTQVYLAGSQYVVENDVHGQYWLPTWSLVSRRYRGCHQVQTSALARDQTEWERLWRWSEEAVRRSLGEAEVKEG